MLQMGTTMIHAKMYRNKPTFLVSMLVLLALLLTSCSQPHEFTGTELNPARPATDFMGTNWDETPFRLSDLQGKVVVIFFGYTSCPDICPLTLSEMQKVKQLLGERGENLAVVLITVDPERDTIERMEQYISAFDSTFYGVVLDDNTLSEVKQAYGIYAEKVEGDSTQSANYMVDHSGSKLVIDKVGNWRMVYSYGTDADIMVEDLRYLLVE